MCDLVRVYDKLIAFCQDLDGAVLAAAEFDEKCINNWIGALESWKLISLDFGENIDRVETVLNTLTPLVLSASEELQFDEGIFEKHNSHLSDNSVTNEHLQAHLELNGTPKHNYLIADLAQRLARLIQQNNEDSQNA